jgi:hypothetical protein
MNGTLQLESINGCPVVEYRDIDGHPVPYMVTIQRRYLRADGGEFRDGGSEWATITVAALLALLAFDGPVARWLREDTRVDCSTARLVALARGDQDAPAYLWNVNAGEAAR